jgi:endonuclease/exonuclease/phosphatase family metal-dependent hydrolase
MGINGRGKPNLDRAGAVIAELDADIIALQEVLRPFDSAHSLEALCDDLGLHVAFAASRIHKRGELGNALLSRFPIRGVNVFDLLSSRVERRSALAAQFDIGKIRFGVVATHLSLVDRTRWRQVRTLLEHPQWNEGPAVLLGDMNAWRRCEASQSLEDTLHRHNNVKWPATYPSTSPLLSLDRIYAGGAEVSTVIAHNTRAARRASDHLPVIANIVVGDVSPPE